LPATTGISGEHPFVSLARAPTYAPTYLD